jgi:hypothetical protein
MTDSNRTPPTRSPRPFLPIPRFQFSLFWLLVVVTIVALFFGIGTMSRSVMSAAFFALVCCLLPTPLVICAIFGRGDVQAFALGALIPWTMLALRMASYSVVHLLFWLLILPPTCGAIAVLTRRWLRSYD